MEPTLSVLLIDGDSSRLLFMQDFLNDLGYATLTASDAVEGLALFREKSPTVVVCEHRLPALDGVSLCRRFRELSPGTFIQLTSGSVSREVAGQCLEAGASDFIPKPFHPLQIHLNLQRALSLRKMESHAERLRHLLEHRNYLGDLIGGSPPMRSLYQLIDEVATGDIPALVVGGSGTEKLSTARTIHKRSPRASGNLVELRLEDESPEKVREHFGISNDGKGGAAGSTVFEQADGGTLLISEIGRLDETCQQRLFEVLQERHVQPFGTSRPRRLNFRLISTSGDDLFHMTEEGQFRRDLYYRVNIVQIMVPALRERLEDIPILAHHFLKRANKRLGTRVEDFSLEALLTLVNYRWPNNVDELEEVIFKACSSSERGIITHQHLPMELYQAAAELSESDSLANISFKQAKSRFEVQYFTDLLRRTLGNMTQAADLSKVGRPYLYKKLQEHKLRPSDFRAPVSKRRSTATAELRMLKDDVRSTSVELRMLRDDFSPAPASPAKPVKRGKTVGGR